MLTFLTLAIEKCENLKLWICQKETKIFALIFQKYWKQNQKSTKYFEFSWKPRVIPVKFHEMSLVLWNLINYCKIMQFLFKFWKIKKNIVKMTWKNSQILS
jgi:hypothetical protein